MASPELLSFTWPSFATARLVLELQSGRREERKASPRPQVVSFSGPAYAFPPKFPQKIPLTSHWPAVCHVASLNSEEGGKFHLAFSASPEEKLEEKGIESVSWASQPKVSGSTGEEKQC